MAIKKDTNSLKFHSGRGNVSGELAKSNAEILSQESEVMATEAEGVNPGGPKVDDYGAKPIHIDGASPFHHGRGLGRGHGPETK